MGAGLSSDALRRASRILIDLTADDLGLETLLQSVADAAREIVGAHQAACALSVDTRPTALNAVSLSERYAAWRDWDVPLQAGGITTWAREQNRAMRFTHDELLAHPAWTGFGRFAKEHPPMRGYLVAPFTDRAGRNLGLLQLSDPYADEFTDDDLEIASFLAGIGSAAIHQQQLVEEARSAQRQLEAVTDALPGGILVRDTDGRITFTNRWLADYLGVARDQFPGSEPGSPYELVDEHLAPLPIDSYPSVRASLGDSFDSMIVGIPGPGGDLRWLATSGRPLLDDGAELLGGLIVFVDATEQVELRRSLANRELQLRDAQRIAGIGSWTRDIRSGETTVSEEMRRIVGIGPHDPIDREVLYDFVHPDDRAALFEGTYRTFTDGVPYSAVLRGVLPSGEERAVEVHAARYDGPDGQPEGLFGTVRDLTEILDEEERMARAQRMETIGRLAGGLAHDFNNLLTVLSGHAELLRASATEAQRASIDAIASATERASRLTRQLLEYGRRDVLQPEPVDVDRLIRELHSMARSAIPAGTVLELGLGAGGTRAMVDPRKLEQVVLNLVLNARDALADTGRIVVSTDVVDLDAVDDGLAPGRYVRIRVTDDGPGMAADVLDRAMEPFFTTKPQGAGTGLGLATSYGIVAQSGGALRLDSDPGVGTIATVLLPFTADDGVDDGAERARPEAGPLRATILLAEDDDQLRPLLESTLTLAGHHVLVGSDGDDAFQVAAQWGRAIDLLVTDVSMPGIGGRELAVRLAAVHPGLAVLFMSGYTDDETLRDAAEHRSVDFLAKPFRLERFRTEVDAILRRHGG